MRRFLAVPVVLTVGGLWLLTGALCQADPLVLVDGQPLAEAAPLNHQGSLLLPMRAVFEALQAQVTWRAPERKLEARRGERLIELWIGTPVATVNRTPVQLQAPPRIIAGTTYVPLRLVCQALGATVRWDPQSRLVTIQSTPEAISAAP